MGAVEAIIMGIVQGLTEFLPVSSSGHLVLMQRLFGITGENIAFDVAVHLGSLIAVIIVFRKTIWDLIKHPFSPLAIKLYLATIPTVLIVLLFKSTIEGSFTGDFFIVGFVLTIFILIISEYIAKKYKNEMPITKTNAVILGIAQGLATLPGVSRSGTTISTGLIMGNRKSEVAEFSFLMSIPIIIASAIYELIFKMDYASFDIVPMLLGMLFAFVFGFIAIKWMLQLVRKANLLCFAIYLIILVAVILIFGLV